VEQPFGGSAFTGSFGRNQELHFFGLNVGNWDLADLA
jgi:hypothetical protein